MLELNTECLCPRSPVLTDPLCLWVLSSSHPTPTHTQTFPYTSASQVPGLLLRSSKEAQFPHFIIQSQVVLHATASGSPFEHTKTHTKTNGMSLCHCITTTTANKIASYSALEAQDNW